LPGDEGREPPCCYGRYKRRNDLGLMGSCLKKKDRGAAREECTDAEEEGGGSDHEEIGRRGIRGRGGTGGIRPPPWKGKKEEIRGEKTVVKVRIA